MTMPLGAELKKVGEAIATDHDPEIGWLIVRALQDRDTLLHEVMAKYDFRLPAAAFDGLVAEREQAEIIRRSMIDKLSQRRQGAHT